MLTKPTFLVSSILLSVYKYNRDDSFESSPFCVVMGRLVEVVIRMCFGAFVVAVVVYV